MTKQEKLYANFAGTLAQFSNSICRTLVKPAPVSRTKTQIKEFVSGLGFDATISLSDSLYYVDTWERWLKAIEIDWTNLHKYIKDSYDCDNFADSFNARMAETYGWNTAGRLSVELLNPKTENHIGWHRASLIVALVNGELTAFAYDPMIGMNDEWDKLEDSFIQIKNWNYVPNFISFN